MTFKYEDFKDKTKEGITAEVEKGLAHAVFYEKTVNGMPEEFLIEQFDSITSDPKRLLMYLSLRNEKPEVFANFRP